MTELAELSGFGSWPEPPDIVPLRILGLAAMPALQCAADAIAAQRPEVAELTWARDVLLRKVPAIVTANGTGFVHLGRAHNGELDRARENRRQARANRACADCGCQFTPARADARYCSPACRQRAHQEGLTHAQARRPDRAVRR